MFVFWMVEHDYCSRWKVLSAKSSKGEKLQAIRVRGKSGPWGKSSMSKDLFEDLFMEWNDTIRRRNKQIQKQEQPRI